MKLRVDEIIDCISNKRNGEGQYAGTYPAQEVSCAVIDSRLVEAGGVFLATPGERVDGHKFIGQVFEKGAMLVVTEKSPQQVEAEHGIPASVWGAYVLVEDSFTALRDIATYYREQLSIPVVGITGSVGKTSTKEFIAGILAEEKCVLKTEGNYNNAIGVPLTLLRIRPEHEVAVVEMGISDFGEMTVLTQMAKPDIAVITNIGQCHLENLGDRDGILRAKTEIFKGMKEGAHVCLYAGDDKLASIREACGGAPHFFGLEPDDEVYATDLESHGLLGTGFVAHFAQGAEEIAVQVPLPGIHMVINALAGASVAKVLGYSVQSIARGISHMQPVGGRNQIHNLPKFMILEDCYNANPVSMKSSLDLLCMADGAKIAILGDMFELGAEEKLLHRQVGEYAATKELSCLITIGDLASEIYEGCLAAGTIPEVLHFSTKELFVKAFCENVEKIIPRNACVLLKASHGMHFETLVELLKEKAQ